MRLKAPVAITSGDPSGIGPEVIAKGLKRLTSSKKLRWDSVVILGEPSAFSEFRSLLPRELIIRTVDSADDLRSLPLKRGGLVFLRPTGKTVAHRTAHAIELAARGCLNGSFRAMCNGPIDKMTLKDAGLPYIGHTDFLRDLCGVKSVTMMLANRHLRVSLVTVHSSIRKVSEQISEKSITTALENTIVSLKEFYGIRHPRIAVLGLNPHAGDGGLIGDEEIQTIVPTLKRLKKRFARKARIEGPFPPDGFLGAACAQKSLGTWDALIAMYHDQGLIPVKMLDFDNTVNISLGLPIVRTSVDHGVGRDIVGRNLANPSSLCAALMLAIKLT